MKKAWLCALLSILLSNAHAQEYLIKTENGRGFIHEHAPTIAHLVRSHPSHISFSFYKKSFGEKKWQSHYNYPDIGATFLYVDYKNKILGKSIAVIPNYSFYFRHPEKRFNGKFDIGIGPAYHTNPYDKQENNKNNVLGTRFSYGIILKTTAIAKITETIGADLGIGMIHFSNGSVSKPNKGINIFSISAGATYKLGDKNISYKKDTIGITYNPKWNLVSVLSTGFSETLTIGSGSHPFFNFLLFAEKALNFKRRIGFGIEYFHTLSLKEEIIYDWRLDGQTPDFKRVAGVIGYEQFVGSTSFVAQAGYYVYDPYEPFDPFYVRIGIRHSFNDHFFAGLTVKSHYFKAEAAEWSVGYRL